MIAPWWLCLVLAAALPAPEGMAGGAGAVLARANEAYQAGDYPLAAELYQELLGRGFEEGRLHFNVGNALLRQGEVGRAIAAYRRAQRLRPRDRDVEANLSFARRSARDALRPPAPSKLAATIFFWHWRLSPRELLAATVALNVLFWSLLAMRQFRPRSEPLRWAAGLSLVLLLAAGLSLGLRHAAALEVAVVVPREAAARSGTGADAVVRFHLQAGAEVRVVERRDGWLRVRLPSGEEGWLEDGSAEVVSF